MGSSLNTYAATGCIGTDLSNVYCFCTSYNANDLSAALGNNCPNANDLQCRSFVLCSCKVSRIVAKDDETDLILNSSQCGQHCAGLRPGSRTRRGQYHPTPTLTTMPTFSWPSIDTSAATLLSSVEPPGAGITLMNLMSTHSANFHRH